MAFRSAACLAVGTAAVALIASPAIAYYTFTWNRKDPDWLLPKQELAQEATRLWHSETHAPLRFVGGSSHFGNSTAFYSPDRPSGFVLLDFHQAPWVAPQALWRDGLLAVCMRDDTACIQAATRLMHADTTHMGVVAAAQLLGSRTRAGDDRNLHQPSASRDAARACGASLPSCHCEVRSDPRVKPKGVRGNLGRRAQLDRDCFASLAMTNRVAFARSP